MRGLYAIVDLDALAPCGLNAVEAARRVLSARPAAVQLRAKQASARDTLTLLHALAPLCREAGVALFANDRPDLALLAGCDGVHVGQEDLPLAEVRRFVSAHGGSGLRIGVSTHTPEQLAAALAERPDYVAFGPVFATASKSNADRVVGLDGLAAAARTSRRAGVPLVAIGGITLERARLVAPHCEAVAVIGALLAGGADAVSGAAVALQAALGSAA